MAFSARERRTSGPLRADPNHALNDPLQDPDLVGRLSGEFGTILTPFDTLADDRVRDYTRKEGTYVQPHMRSTPEREQEQQLVDLGQRQPVHRQAGNETS